MNVNGFIPQSLVIAMRSKTLRGGLIFLFIMVIIVAIGLMVLSSMLKDAFSWGLNWAHYMANRSSQALGRLVSSLKL